MAVGEKGKKTKHKIFRTAIRLFKEEGYDNVTVDEIVKEAGIAKGTFYIYFETKAQIVAEIFMEMDIFYEDSMKKIENLTSSIEKIRLLFEDIIDIQNNYVGYDLSVIGYRTQLETHMEYSMDKKRTIYRYVTALVKEGQSKGEINKDELPEYYAKILLRSVRGAIYEWCLSNNNYDFAEDSKKYLRCLMKILA